MIEDSQLSFNNNHRKLNHDNEYSRNTIIIILETLIELQTI
jgi:hypothetical protein